MSTVNFYPGTIDGLTLVNNTFGFNAGLKVQNTSNQQIDIKSIAGNLTSLPTNTLIGNVGLFQAVSIPPNSQATVQLPIQLVPISLVQDIISAIQTGSLQEKLHFKGYANIDTYQVPIEYDYSVP